MDAEEYLEDSAGHSPLEVLMSQFSFSKLYAFAMCPRKWYYRYVAGVPDDTGFLVYGKAVHHGMEVDNLAKLKGVRLKWENLLEAAVEKLKAESVLKGVEVKLDIFAKEHATHLQKLEKDGVRASVRPIEGTVEAPFEISLNLKDPKTGEPEPAGRILGFVDTLSLSETGAREVVDYKSGARPTYQADSKKSLQFPLYAVGGKAPQWRVISFVRGGRQKPTIHVTEPEVLQQSQLSRVLIFLENTIRQVRAALRSGDFPMCSPNAYYCSAEACAYHGKCYPREYSSLFFSLGEVKPVGTMEKPEWRK